jgi:hypothetical protein
MMDWNWFFSSVAQSSAAIVAVFSAFIITKIINNQSQFESNKRRIKKLLNESLRYKELATYRRIGWYSQYLFEKEIKKMDDPSRLTKITENAEEYYFNNGFPPFVKRDRVIQRIQQSISRSSYIKVTNPKDDPFASIKSATEISDERHFVEEQNAIYSLVVDIKHHVAILNDFIEELSANPESSTVIRWSIIASMSLFYVGVIYPLGFLPLPQNSEMSLSLRYIPDYIYSFCGLLLFVLALIFTGINLFFLNINSKMVYATDRIGELKAFSTFGDYSVYFKNMEDNHKAKEDFQQKVVMQEAQ